jgi:hypothetical protein
MKTIIILALVRALGRGDPLSPVLFNLVVDIFTRMLIKAIAKGYIHGFMQSVCHEGVIGLQYADDALLFLRHNIKDSCHLKWLMMCFEHLSSMKINYSKSDMVPVNLEEETQVYVKIFCYNLGAFPFKYLGAPLHHEKLKREDIQRVVDKIIKKIPGWQGKLMAYATMMALLKACLASIPIYLMSVIKFPKWAIKAINSQRGDFFLG